MTSFYERNYSVRACNVNSRVLGRLNEIDLSTIPIETGQ